MNVPAANAPAPIPEAAHWLPPAEKFCCRCLSNKPVEGGRNSGLSFTCRECRETLEAKPS